jgi:hypothetical protein
VKLANGSHPPSPFQHEQTPRFCLMSHSHLTAASSFNFQLIIDNAVKAYERRTKKDLLAHPLASQLQTCDSPGAILDILQQQIQGLDQSRSSDDRWTKWLDPTVNILFALSATLGEGVGLVNLRAWTCPRSAHIYMAGFLTCKGDICRSWRSSLSAHHS